jgi:hypothetical protein
MLWKQEACFRCLQEQALALHKLVGYTTDREFTCTKHSARGTLPRRFLFDCVHYTLPSTKCIFVPTGIPYLSSL